MLINVNHAVSKIFSQINQLKNLKTINLKKNITTPSTLKLRLGYLAMFLRIFGYLRWIQSTSDRERCIIYFIIVKGMAQLQLQLMF